MVAEAEVLDLSFQRLAQFAVAEDDESRVGQQAHDARGGGDQMLLALVRDQRRDVADERRVVREAEGRMRVDLRDLVDLRDVDALVHDRDPIRCDAVLRDHVGDQRRGADPDVDLVVLPAREGVALQMEVHAPRGHEQWPFLWRERRLQRHAGQRDAVRIVRMNHVRPDVVEDARELPRRADVEFAAG